YFPATAADPEKGQGKRTINGTVEIKDHRTDPMVLYLTFSIHCPVINYLQFCGPSVSSLRLRLQTLLPVAPGIPRILPRVRRRPLSSRKRPLRLHRARP